MIFNLQERLKMSFIESTTSSIALLLFYLGHALFLFCFLLCSLCVSLFHSSKSTTSIQALLLFYLDGRTIKQTSPISSNSLCSSLLSILHLFGRTRGTSHLKLVKLNFNGNLFGELFFKLPPLFEFAIGTLIG